MQECPTYYIIGYNTKLNRLRDIWFQQKIMKYNSRTWVREEGDTIRLL